MLQKVPRAGIRCSVRAFAASVADLLYPAATVAARVRPFLLLRCEARAGTKKESKVVEFRKYSTSSSRAPYQSSRAPKVLSYEQVGRAPWGRADLLAVRAAAAVRAVAAAGVRPVGRFGSRVMLSLFFVSRTAESFSENKNKNRNKLWARN